MQKLLTGMITALMLCGLSLSVSAAERPDLLTVITSDSNDTQAMALILTRASVQQGSGARILLCDHAGELAVKGSDMGSTVVQPADASPRQMLAGLIQAGVTVEVCAIFLPNRVFDEGDLVDGVGIARPGPIAEFMAAPDTRLFTF
ncbi:MAG: hypothetical protein JJT90_06185 [Ectothiorhodospiraceae bacterium]|nr:hypothetical protein [Ectothiorhodospiraceae bacterium]